MVVDSQLAPDFTLTDTAGNPVTLSVMRGICNVVLVFNRGFACPFCRQHLLELRRGIEDFRARRTVILVIAPERIETVQETWERELYPFVGLADPAHVVATAYDQRVDLFHTGRLPALFVIDRGGRIRFSHHGGSPADIPGHDEILQMLDQFNLE